jgi:hypothetical protein
MDYNPYELLNININGKKAYGRPVEYDSGTTGPNSVKNSFGFYVKPIKIVTTCPDCGQGLELNVRYPDPPFPVVEFACYICRSKSQAVIDPFVDPFKGGNISLEDINPSIYKLERHDLGDTTVAERLSKDTKKKGKPKSSKKAKKSEEDIKKKVGDAIEAASNDVDGFVDYGKKKNILEAADGLEPEQFDDADLIE